MTSEEIVNRVKANREAKARREGTFKPPHQPKDSPAANWSVFTAIAVPAVFMALVMLVMVMRERPAALPQMMLIVSIATGGLSLMFRHIMGIPTAQWASYDKRWVRWATATGLVTALILAGGGILMAITAILQSATN